MKKQSLLLITGGLLAIASCNTEPAGNAEDAQAKIDSAVNARVEEIRLELQAQNDSIINEMAMYRADSIIAARTGKAAPARPRPSAPASTDRATETSKEVQEEKPRGGVDDRQGATNKQGGVSDREGATNKQGGVNDREGASNNR
ncbi:MAG TPA: hypothetical protein VIN07_10300 [Flavipsychrobacter sp.]